MKFLKPVAGTITASFHDKRPLSLANKKDLTDKEKDQLHIHGAIDIKGNTGAPIQCPETGRVFCWAGVRYKDGQYWPSLPMVNGHIFSFANYFYDMYGGVIVIQVPDEKGEIIRTHLICHSYGNQMFNLSIFKDTEMNWVEEEENERFPIHGVYSNSFTMKAGQIIGYVGNAGYSTGPHVHWEIHNGDTWNKHEDRIQPVKYL